MNPPDAFRIFRNRPFVLLWLAQLCSSLGDAVVQVTLMNSVLQAGGHAGEGIAKVLDVAVKKLNQAQVICIFPEGRLTTDGSINPFNKGVAYIHKKSHAPLVPFAIHGGFEAWAYNKPFPTFRPITIEFSAPFHDLDSHDKVVTQGL
jgi:1-acyl-sn-glycerol-3-phosphate acyltransferase